MAFPKIEVVVDADTTRAEAGFDRVEKSMDQMGRGATRASSRVQKLGGGINTVRAPARGMQNQFRNLGFQINDFATQVGAGTRASVALGQQLPQLLQGFGGLGIALSVIAAIGIPVVSALRGINTEGQDMGRMFGVLQPAIEGIGRAFTAVAGIAVNFAEAIINNLDRIVITAGVAAAVFAGPMVAGFIAARVAAFSLVGALTALRTILIRTGIGALIIAAGELIYQFTRLVSAAGGVGAAIGLVGDVFKEVFERMRMGVSLMGEIFQGLGMVIEGAFLTAFGAVQDAFTTMINKVITGLNVVRGMGGADPIALMEGGTAGAEGEALMGAGSAVMGSAAGSLGEAMTAPLESVQKIRDLLASIKDDRITLPDLLGAPGADEEGGGGKKKDATTQALEAQKQALEAVKQQGRDTYTALAGFLQQFAGKSKAAAIAVIAINKAMAIAQAIQNTAVAVTKALTIDPTGVLAARTALLGKVQIGLIAATGLAQAAGAGGGGGGGGAPISAGGVGGGGAGVSASAPRQNTTITLVGDVFSGEQVADLLNEFADRGGRLQENIIVRRA